MTLYSALYHPNVSQLPFFYHSTYNGTESAKLQVASENCTTKSLDIYCTEQTAQQADGVDKVL